MKPAGATEASDSARSGTQAIERAVLLMRIIATQGRRGMRSAQIAQAAGLAATTTTRILQCLASEGLIEKDEKTKKFFLSYLLHELGMVAQPRYSLRDLALPPMNRLAQVTQDTVYLSERSGLEAVCTARVIGDYPIKAVPLDVGIRRPMGVGAGGMAILAAMPEEEAELVIAANEPLYPGHNHLSADEVRRGVAEARQRGFSLVGSVVVPGMLAMGMALPGAQAAISVAAISGRLSPERAQSVALELRRTLEQIQRAVDGRLARPRG